MTCETYDTCTVDRQQQNDTCTRLTRCTPRYPVVVHCDQGCLVHNPTTPLSSLPHNHTPRAFLCYRTAQICLCVCLVCAESTRTDEAEKGWGLRAERDLEVDEIGATIPRSMCIGLLASQRDHRTEYDTSTTREQGPWTGPPCIQALVDQVPEEFADIRCVETHS